MYDAVSPSLADVVSAILVLAGTRITGGIPRWVIHSIMWHMKREEPLLSRLRFSITGDVCFSGDIETAINNLLARGTLRTAKDGTILPSEMTAHRVLNHARRSRSNIAELLTASRNFCQRFEEWRTTASREAG